MSNSRNRPIHKNSDRRDQRSSSQQQSKVDIEQKITETIENLNDGLKNYPIRVLVDHAKEFGPDLKQQRLETNQIRKFLDAINQIKSKVAKIYEESGLSEEEKKGLKSEEIEKKVKAIVFQKIETDIVLLKPKLAYAAARQRAVKSLNNVMAIAIDRVRSLEDFERLVQFIESIIAYHKAADGK